MQTKSLGGPHCGARLIVAIKRERNDTKSQMRQKHANKSPIQSEGTRNPKHGPKQNLSPTNFAAKSARPSKPPQRGKINEEGLIWGVHPVLAALSNPNRLGPLRLYLSQDRQKHVDLNGRKDIVLSVLESPDLSRLVPQGAVHQGMVLSGPVPDGVDLETLNYAPNGVILMLDQVTDPQNIGAILRSCAAFGVVGLIIQDRHSPPMQGVLAKTAAGAMDRIDFCRVTNLSRTLESLSENGWISIGLSGDVTQSLKEQLDHIAWRDQVQKLVLVMGSEGDGLRRLVAEHCDHLAKIPMPGDFESLNVSHATSIALYEALGR